MSIPPFVSASIFTLRSCLPSCCYCCRVKPWCWTLFLSLCHWLPAGLCSNTSTPPLSSAHRKYLKATLEVPGRVLKIPTVQKISARINTFFIFSKYCFSVSVSLILTLILTVYCCLPILTWDTGIDHMTADDETG